MVNETENQDDPSDAPPILQRVENRNHRGVSNAENHQPILREENSDEHEDFDDAEEEHVNNFEDDGDEFDEEIDELSGEEDTLHNEIRVLEISSSDDSEAERIEDRWRHDYMGLPYADHNYDTYHKEDRAEKDTTVFPTIDGLDEPNASNAGEENLLASQDAPKRIQLAGQSPLIFDAAQPAVQRSNRLEGSAYRGFDDRREEFSVRPLPSRTLPAPSGFREVRPEMYSQVGDHARIGVGGALRSTAVPMRRTNILTSQSVPKRPSLPPQRTVLPYHVGTNNSPRRLVPPARPMVTEVAQPQSMPVQMSSESAPQKIVTTPAEQPPHRLLGSAAPEPSRMPQPGHHGNGPAPMFVPARGTRFSQRGRVGSVPRRKLDSSDDSAASTSASHAEVHDENVSRSLSPRKQVHFSESPAHHSPTRSLVPSEIGLHEPPMPPAAYEAQHQQMSSQSQHSPQLHPQTSFTSPPQMKVGAPPILARSPARGVPMVRANPQKFVAAQYRQEVPPARGVIHSMAQPNPNDTLPENFIDDTPPVQASTPVKQSLSESSLPPEVAEMALSIASPNAHTSSGNTEMTAEEIKAKIDAITMEIAQEQETIRRQSDSANPVGFSNVEIRQRGRTLGQPSLTRPPGLRIPDRPRTSSTSSMNISSGFPDTSAQRQAAKGVRTLPPRQTSEYGSSAGSPSYQPMEKSSPRVLLPTKPNVPMPNGAVQEERVGDKSLEEVEPGKFVHRTADGEVDYITRCICEYGHDDGKMVACDECEVWQHGACVNVTMKQAEKDSYKYFCEQCRPRKLKYNKRQAREIQADFLKKIRKDEARTRGKPTSVDALETTPKLSTGRKSAVVRDNIYTRTTEDLIGLMSKTPCPKGLLHQLQANQDIATSMVVAINVYGLVACRLVNQGAPILPYFARICLPSEANRHFGVLLPFCVVYEQRSGGLNSHSNLDNCIVIDSRKHGSEARDIRRSCVPNCEIRHEIGLGDHRIFFYIVATQDIEKGTELTIPFDFDWPYSKEPLACACGEDECAIEKQLNNLLKTNGARSVEEFQSRRSLMGSAQERVETTPISKSRPLPKSDSAGSKKSGPGRKPKQVQVKLQGRTRGRKSESSADDDTEEETPLVAGSKSTKTKRPSTIASPAGSNADAETTSSSPKVENVEPQKASSSNVATPQETRRGRGRPPSKSAERRASISTPKEEKPSKDVKEETPKTKTPKQKALEEKPSKAVKVSTESKTPKEEKPLKEEKPAKSTPVMVSESGELSERELRRYERAFEQMDKNVGGKRKGRGSTVEKQVVTPKSKEVKKEEPPRESAPRSSSRGTKRRAEPEPVEEKMNSSEDVSTSAQPPRKLWQQRSAAERPASPALRNTPHAGKKELLKRHQQDEAAKNEQDRIAGAAPLKKRQSLRNAGTDDRSNDAVVALLGLSSGKAADVKDPDFNAVDRKELRYGALQVVATHGDPVDYKLPSNMDSPSPVQLNSLPKRQPSKQGNIVNATPAEQKPPTEEKPPTKPEKKELARVPSASPAVMSRPTRASILSASVTPSRLVRPPISTEAVPTPKPTVVVPVAAAKQEEKPAANPKEETKPQASAPSESPESEEPPKKVGKRILSFEEYKQRNAENSSAALVSSARVTVTTEMSPTSPTPPRRQRASFMPKMDDATSAIMELPNLALPMSPSRSIKSSETILTSPLASVSKMSLDNLRKSILGEETDEANTRSRASVSDTRPPPPPPPARRPGAAAPVADMPTIMQYNTMTRSLGNTPSKDVMGSPARQLSVADRLKLEFGIGNNVEDSPGRDRSNPLSPPSAAPNIMSSPRSSIRQIHTSTGSTPRQHLSSSLPSGSVAPPVQLQYCPVPVDRQVTNAMGAADVRSSPRRTTRHIAH